MSKTIQTLHLRVYHSLKDYIHTMQCFDSGVIGCRHNDIDCFIIDIPKREAIRYLGNQKNFISNFSDFHSPAYRGCLMLDSILVGERYS